MINPEIQFLQVIMMLIVAVASGLVGTFALMRKMTLAADAISHVALPGLGLAVLFEINPLVGAVAALFLGSLLIWAIETKTRLTTETIIGVFFSAALAVGSLLTSGEELIDTLFGEAAGIDIATVLFGLAGSLVVILFILFQKERLTLELISVDLAKVTGINVRRLNLYFLLVFSLTVVVGLQFLGVLLIGSLIIVPAAAAWNWARSLNSALSIAALIAVSSVLIGVFVYSYYGLPMGPITITAAAGLFFASLFWR